jgi:hypothetical protein
MSQNSRAVGDFGYLADCKEEKFLANNVFDFQVLDLILLRKSRYGALLFTYQQ